MSSPTLFFDDADPAMHQAYAAARAAFRYFWRELYWERRRIIPAFGLVMAKLPFTDGPRTDGQADYEHMWIGDVEFDGETVSGTLMNAPNYLTSVSEGDTVRMPLAHLSDWLISLDGRTYGGFTIQCMRTEMDGRERKEHDAAWGLDFGDPAEVRLEPSRAAPRKSGMLAGLFGGRSDSVKPDTGFQDSPMCINMLPKIDDYLKADPAIARSVDEAGWTMLHREALAGNLGIVKLLLGYGADAGARTPAGQTAEQVARDAGWTEIADALLTPTAY